MDALTLARLQFGTTVIYHFLFVPLTLGLVVIVALMETFYVASGKDVYKRMAQFWGKLYLINYAVGIVTGIVQEFQFGMSWSNFANFTGNVFGAPLAIETLLAFFVESTFLGTWIFGWDYLPKKVHMVLIWIVTVGAYLSAFWILTANAFMQHPVGYVVRDGVAYMTSFTALLTNPNFLIALPHVIGGAFLTGAFFVVGISAYHFIKRTDEQEFFRRSMRIGLVLALVGSLVVIIAGMLQVELVKDYQPVKWAATIGELATLTQYQTAMQGQHGPGNYLPPSSIDDPAFHIMFFVGIALLLISLISVLLLIKGLLFRLRWFMWLLLVSLALPYIANIGGWLFRETGRQPWIIYQVMTVQQGLSPGVGTGTLLVSLISFALLYGILAVTDAFLLTKYARLGTQDIHEQEKENRREEFLIA